MKLSDNVFSSEVFILVMYIDGPPKESYHFDDMQTAAAFAESWFEADHIGYKKFSNETRRIYRSTNEKGTLATIARYALAEDDTEFRL